MKIDELITELQQLRDEYGDLEVRATNDGYAPPEIAVYVRPEQKGVLLYGQRSVDTINPTQQRDMELING